MLDGFLRLALDGKRVYAATGQVGQRPGFRPLIRVDLVRESVKSELPIQNASMI